MWINVLYDNDTGMNCSVMGPYKTREDALDPAGVPVHAREMGCWTPIEVTPPAGADVHHLAGSVVVFDGNITREEWVFYGPFVDLAAAYEWAASLGIDTNCVIKLKPVPAMMTA